MGLREPITGVDEQFILVHVSEPLLHDSLICHCEVLHDRTMIIDFRFRSSDTITIWILLGNFWIPSHHQDVTPDPSS